jgi:Double zinc ribbon
MRCPNCGREAAGKFCSNCGAALRGAICPSCAAPLPAGARFCHACGTALGAPRRPASPGPLPAGSQARLVPWIVAGIAVAVLVVVLVARYGAGAAPSAAAASPTGSGTGPNGMPDLSQMSPQEQADRLFDRVMTAHEQGDSQQVTFFGPMALQATAALGTLNDDEHYHVGLINAALGNFAATAAEADTIARDDPHHLFVPLLRWEVADHDKDAAGMRRAYRQFLDDYDQEIATGKPEYTAHKTRLDAFREEARDAVGKRGG